MSERTNEFGQPIGAPVADWTPRAAPPRTPMVGRYCRVEPLDPQRHGAQLHAANAHDAGGRNMTYLFTEPLPKLDAYRAWLEQAAKSDDPLFHAISDSGTGQAVGVAAFMRIDRAHGVIEIGHLNFSPLMQRSRVSTEALYLMMRRAFRELGYRRCEWKCDSLNAPSRAAAERLGFRFEGIFRQAVVYKGRNRDTAWFSVTDAEWPALEARFERWLAPGNFDASGGQRESLGRI
jgi:RimJ/RimL family protein N-acetyltransferase